MKPLYTVTLDREQIAEILEGHILAIQRESQGLVARASLPIQLTEVSVTVSPKRAPVKLKLKAAE